MSGFKPVFVCIFIVLSLTIHKTSMSSAPAKSLGQKSYQYLTTVQQKYYQPKVDAANLEMLGALIAKHTADHVLEILGKTKGKNNPQYQYVQKLAEPIIETLNDIRRSQKMADAVKEAFQWVEGQLKSYEQRKEDSTVSKYQQWNKIPAAQLRQLLNDELNTIDMFYKPVIQTLKTILATQKITKKSTTLFDSVTLLDFLYINALE